MKDQGLHSSISAIGTVNEDARCGMGGVWTPLHSELPELTKDWTLTSDSIEFFWESRGLIWPIRAGNIKQYKTMRPTVIRFTATYFKAVLHKMTQNKFRVRFKLTRTMILHTKKLSPPRAINPSITPNYSLVKNRGASQFINRYSRVRNRWMGNFPNHRKQRVWNKRLGGKCTKS